MIQMLRSAFYAPAIQAECLCRPKIGTSLRARAEHMRKHHALYLASKKARFPRGSIEINLAAAGSGLSKPGSNQNKR